MFTGLIKHTAAVLAVSRRGAAGSLAVENPWQAPPAVGESISVNGACLTVESANDRQISFDLSAETLERTVLAVAGPGTVVNLERALRVGDDVSGHFVQGHVDGVGSLEGVVRQGRFATLTFEAPRELSVYIAMKGSIAVNGVSLTVASLERNRFSVAVIPETLERTNLSSLRAGDKVNIETDLIAKHVVRYLEEAGGGKSGGLSLDKLEEIGL